MRTIPFGSLQIPEDRIRSAIDSKGIRELADDIIRHGLYHPIVVRDGPEAESYILVAGMRRYTAISLLAEEGTPIRYEEEEYPTGIIPVTHLGDLDPLVARRIELEENLQRTDLSWKDITRAQAELANLHETRAEAAEALADITNTTTESAKTAVYHAKLLEPHLDDPLLANVTSQRQALRYLLDKFQNELAAIAPKENFQSTLIEADFRLADIPSNSFTTTIADPPYGIDADQFGDASDSVHAYADTPAYALEISQAIITQSFQWSVESAHLFLFCDIELFLILRDYAASVGWDPYRTPLIWNKRNGGHIPWGPSQWKRSTELILYARKGKANLNSLRSSCIDVVPARDSTHGAAKPPDLYHTLLSLTTIPGDMVIDPCCGSGPIFTAGEALRTTAWGLDIDISHAHTAQAEAEEQREKRELKRNQNALNK